LAAAATYFVFRIGLGEVCLLAGLEKARAPRELFLGVERYRLLPRGPRAGGRRRADRSRARTRGAPRARIDLDAHKLLTNHITS
jgi:hypothetical protein